MTVRVAVVVCLLLALGAGSAAPAQDGAGESARDTRATRLAEVLRCLVCQNQSIADSNAPLARDLKQQIHEQIAQGRSDPEILDYMVARYGDFVLYRPPMKWTTILLWGGPFAALLAGLLALGLRLSRAGREQRVLSDAETARAAGLLRADRGRSAT